MKALLRDGNEGDQRNFNTPFDKIFNSAMKSNMSDSERRIKLVKYMAENEAPNAEIQGWMNEYAEMEANLPKILESKEDVGYGISIYDCSIGRHDPTTVFTEAYKSSPIVILKSTIVFIEGKKQEGVIIATNNNSLNILDVIQKAKISAGGMAVRANLAFKDLGAAIEAISKEMAKNQTAT